MWRLKEQEFSFFLVVFIAVGLLIVPQLGLCQEGISLYGEIDSVPGSSGIPVSFSTPGDHEMILYGKDLEVSFDLLEELIRY